MRKTLAPFKELNLSGTMERRIAQISANFSHVKLLMIVCKEEYRKSFIIQSEKGLLLVFSSGQNSFSSGSNSLCGRLGVFSLHSELCLSVFLHQFTKDKA